MIESLSLRDFQSHTHLRFDVSPQVTTIVGPSDVGKSAIVRALRLLLLNRPSGEGFIRDGAGQVTVQARIDGRMLGRRKGKQNLYRLDSREFRSFGSVVPDPISQLAQVSDLNFQQQHEPPFWFCLTSGEVARQLNAIVDLSVIDRVTSSLTSKIRANQAEHRVCQARVQEAQQRLDQLEYVPRLVEHHEHLERLGEASVGLTRRAEQLHGVLDRLENANHLQRQAARQSQALHSCLEKLGRVVTLQERRQRLDDCRLRPELLQGKRPIPDVTSLRQRLHRMEESGRQASRIQRVLVEYQNAMERHKSLQRQLEQLHEQHPYLKQPYTGVCPLCGK